jgi:hypothetical protein
MHFRKPLPFLLAGLLATAAAPAFADAYVPIKTSLTGCMAQGHKSDAQTLPKSAEIKRQASLVGLAYINWVYQNDLNNEHFCDVMLRMDRQVTDGVPGQYVDPYVDLFSPEHANETVQNLANVQLLFDYSIDRSKPSATKVETALKSVSAVLGTHY